MAKKVYDVVVEKIDAAIEEYQSNIDKAESVAAAAKRARKATSALTHLFKEFRALSVAKFKK